MKGLKITYWVSTGLISAMMIMAAYGYFTNPMMKTAFVHLGFPDYFRLELGAAKLLGALALIVPMIPRKIKEFAYAGFVIVFVSAFIAHLSSGDPMSVAVGAVVALVVLITSYITYAKLESDKK
jgi:DoxX-like family